MTNMPFENLMDAHALGERLNVQGRTILNWARRGWIPCLRAGRKSVYFDPEAVENALKTRGQWIVQQEAEVVPADTMVNEREDGQAQVM